MALSGSGPSGGGAARWTEMCLFVAGAAGGQTNYYGPEHAGATTSWLSHKGWDTSWGAGPAAEEYSLLPTMPVACKITRLECWVRFNDVSGGALDEDLHVYKIPYTNGADAGTPVLIATTNLNNSGADVNHAYDVSVDISSGNELDAGDCLVILRKNVANPKAYLGRATFFLESL